jgi:hypothetical protein
MSRHEEVGQRCITPAAIGIQSGVLAPFPDQIRNGVVLYGGSEVT